MYRSSVCQEKFLSTLIDNKTPVSIYLKNGIKLTGKIIAATDDIIFLNDPVPQMIYKKRVSTIVPLVEIQQFDPVGMPSD